MTQLTIELPDQLAAQLTAYLETDPTTSLAELIQEALQVRLVPKDGAKLLALAGIVTDAPRGAALQSGCCKGLDRRLPSKTG